MTRTSLPAADLGTTRRPALALFAPAEVRRPLARFEIVRPDAYRARLSAVERAGRRWKADGWAFDTAGHVWSMLRLIVRRKVRPGREVRGILSAEVAAVLADLPPEYARLFELKLRPAAPCNRTAAALLHLSAATVDRMMGLLERRLGTRFGTAT